MHVTRLHITGRAAVLAAGCLVATLLPLASISPAQAAPETCPSEAYDTPLLLTGCDDTQPPTTTITSVSPAPNSTGFTRSSSVAFAFVGAHAGDDDAGTIAFECQMFNTATAPTEWQSCTSPKAYTGLQEHTTTPYTFRVRAVDATDEAITAFDDSVLSAPDPDLPDYDQTPASATLMVDTVAPNTFVNNEPVDTIRPDWPVVLADTVTIGLQSNEKSTTFACTLNGRAITGCGTGQTTLRNLSPGDTTLVARAVDRALNLDLTPATIRFFVPSDIKKSKGSGWKNVRKINQGLFDNDYVESTKVGQTLVIKRIKKVREVRLVALVGPKAGTVEVRVGKSQWYTVNLSAKKARLAQVLVRDEFSPLQSGTIQIRVKSLPGKKSSVRLDALVARN